jgi:hypothetical protein
MKRVFEEREDLHKMIYEKWCSGAYSFTDLADMQWPYAMSMKRISNIVYAGPAKATRIREKVICTLMRIKFLELQDIKATIAWIYENQPKAKLNIRTIRRAVRAHTKRGECV